MSFSKSIKFDTCVYLRLSFAVDFRIHRNLPREIERKIGSKVDRLYVFAWFTHSQICTQALKTLGELRERERERERERFFTQSVGEQWKGGSGR